MAGTGTTPTLPMPICKNQLGKALAMGKPSQIMPDRPYMTFSVASVMMNAGIWNLCSRNECRPPISTATTIEMRMPSRHAAVTLQPVAVGRSRQKRATMTPASATCEPMDRSIWPEMMTMVMPKAMTPFSAWLRRMFMMLLTVRKLELTKLMITTRTIRRISMI